jgi:hypothetical protein
MEIAHLKRVGDQIDRAANRLAIALVIAALIIGSSIVMTVQRRAHAVRPAGLRPAGLHGRRGGRPVAAAVNEITNVPMQVDFEVIDCSQGVALDLLHPLPDPAVERSAGGLRRAERGDPQAGAHDAVNGSQLL